MTKSLAALAPGLFAALTLGLLTACATAPQTHYYNLQALPELNTSMHAELPPKTTLGIGPVKLPSMLHRKGIVTQSSGPAIKIASHNIWAGNLKEDFTRVIAQLMGANLGINDVVTEPWDTRFRPEYQLQMDVQHFSGELGGSVRFKVNWLLSGNYGQDKLVSQSDEFVLQSDDISYAAYVSTLSTLLAKFSAKTVRQVILNKITADKIIAN